MFSHTDHASLRGMQTIVSPSLVGNATLVSLCRTGIHGVGLSSIIGGVRTKATLCRIARTKAVNVITISTQRVRTWPEVTEIHSDDGGGFCKLPGITP